MVVIFGCVAILFQGGVKRIGDGQELKREQSEDEDGVEGEAEEGGLEVELEVAGDESKLRNVLGPLGSLLQETASHSWSLKTKLNNQTEVDQLVDSLRAAGISLIYLARRRASLEDAFVQIVSAEVV